MSANNYYVSHHGMIDVQTKGKITEDEKYDEGYSRNEVENRVIELLREAMSGSSFAEIVISVSGNLSRVIKFGQAGDEVIEVLDED